MAQHLSQHHPAQVRKKDVLVLVQGDDNRVEAPDQAQKIANDISSEQLINGRNEHIAPAFQQMAPTDILGKDIERRNGR